MNSKIIFFAFIFSGPIFAMQDKTGWNPLKYLPVTQTCVKMSR